MRPPGESQYRERIQLIKNHSDGLNPVIKAVVQGVNGVDSGVVAFEIAKIKISDANHRRFVIDVGFVPKIGSNPFIGKMEQLQEMVGRQAEQICGNVAESLNQLIENPAQPDCRPDGIKR